MVGRPKLTRLPDVTSWGHSAWSNEIISSFRSFLRRFPAFCTLKDIVVSRVASKSNGSVLWMEWLRLRTMVWCAFKHIASSQASCPSNRWHWHSLQSAIVIQCNPVIENCIKCGNYLSIGCAFRFTCSSGWTASFDPECCTWKSALCRKKCNNSDVMISDVVCWLIQSRISNNERG